MKVYQISLLFILTILFSSTPQSGAATIYTLSDLQKMKKSWTALETSEAESIITLLHLLSESKSGKQIIEKAQYKAMREGVKLHEIVKAGNGSLTDTTLLRRFTYENPIEIAYVTKTTVYINRNLKPVDALFDLAHELTHYVYRPTFNPYVRVQHLSEFVTSTIEGPGGEVDAFLNECYVSKDFGLEQEKCKELVENGKYSQTLAKKKFYQLGEYAESFYNKITEYNYSKEDFMNANAESVFFVSSAYGMPYPLAAIEEYRNITAKACDNDKKRIMMMASGQLRYPASLGNKFIEIKQNFEKRCGK